MKKIIPVVQVIFFKMQMVIIIVIFMALLNDGICLQQNLTTNRTVSGIECESMVGNYTLNSQIYNITDQSNLTFPVHLLGGKLTATGRLDSQQKGCCGKLEDIREVSTSRILSSISFIYRNTSCILYMRKLDDKKVILLRKLDCMQDQNKSIVTTNIVFHTTNATLGNCKYEHMHEVDNVNICWLRNGKIVPSSIHINSIGKSQQSSDEILKEYPAPSIQIDSFKQEGLYQCMVKLPMYKEPFYSKAYILKIPRPTLWRNLTILSEANASFGVLKGCILESVLPLHGVQFYYLFNNTIIINTTSKNITINGKMLWKFTDHHIENDGVYKFAANINGEEILYTEISFKRGEETKIFKSVPSKPGKSTKVQGCQYTYIERIPMRNSYLTLNGVKLGMNSTQKFSQDGIKENSAGVFNMESYHIKSYLETGSYRCVLRIEEDNLTFTSEAYFVGLNDLPVPTLWRNLTILSKADASFGVLKGCILESVLPLHGVQFYYLFNNTIIINTTSTNITINGKMLWKFTDHHIKKDGVYKFAANINGEEILYAKFSFKRGEETKMFKSAPSKPGKSTKIQGCQYTYIERIPTRNSYLTLNGIKLGMSSTQQISQDGINENSAGVFNMESYHMKSYAETGSYRCVLRIEENSLTFTSEPYFVGLNDLPEPVFDKQPKILQRNTTENKGIILGGCAVTTELIIPSKYFLYLKTGYEVLHVNKNPSKSGKRVWSFPELRLESNTLSNQGYYQCLVRINGTDFISESVTVQFPNVSTFRITVTMKNRKFIKDYNNRSSQAFKNLEKEVITNLRKNDGSSNQYFRVLKFRNGSIIADVDKFVGNQTLDSISKSCRQHSGPNITQKDDFYVEVTPLNCCPKIKQGHKEFKGRYVYESTVAGSNYSQPCKYGNTNKTMKIVRLCQQNLKEKPMWLAADLSQCLAKLETTNDLIKLEKELEKNICNKSMTNTTQCETPLKASSTLKEIINSSNAIHVAEDVKLVSSVFTKIVQNIDFGNTDNDNTIVKNITNNLFNVVDNLIKINETIMNPTESSLSGTQKTPEDKPLAAILEGLDKLANGLGSTLKTPNESIEISRSELAFQVVLKNPRQFSVIAVKGDNGKVSLRTVAVKPDTNFQNKTLALFDAKDLTNDTSSNASVIYSYFFRKPTLFRRNHNRSNTQSSLAKTIVGSAVLAVSIVAMVDKNNLNSPINLTFEKRSIDEKIFIVDDQKCKFWNESSGDWKENGCRLIYENETIVICQCNHLTNFALLFDVSQKISFQNHHISMSIVTWIGCGLSLCGLVLTIFTYIKFTHLLKKMAPKILLCLCSSMVLLLVTFLGGVEEPEPRVKCQIIASLIHYFLLSTFSWMSVEAFNMYRSFVKVFAKGDSGQTKFIVRSSLISWGATAAVAIATGFAVPENLGDENFCLVKGMSFYIGVLIPIGGMLIFNFVVLIFVMRALTNRTMVIPQKSSSKSQNILKQTKITFACSVLLGLTWIFALFTIDGNDASIVFQWLFTIFNSLQGFFIFIFYTWTSPEIRTEWSKVLPTIRIHDYFKSRDTNYSFSGTWYNSTNSTTNSTTVLNTIERSSNRHSVIPTDDDDGVVMVSKFTSKYTMKIVD